MLKLFRLIKSREPEIDRGRPGAIFESSFVDLGLWRLRYVNLAYIKFIIYPPKFHKSVLDIVLHLLCADGLSLTVIIPPVELFASKTIRQH